MAADLSINDELLYIQHKLDSISRKIHFFFILSIVFAVLVIAAFVVAVFAFGPSLAITGFGFGCSLCAVYLYFQMRSVRLQYIAAQQKHDKLSNKLLDTQCNPQPCLFFAWEIFSLLLPNRIRLALWDPSHWDMKSEYLVSMAKQKSLHRRTLFGVTFAIKSFVIWLQCWWQYLPAKFRYGALAITGVGALKLLAELVGVRLF
jgi:ABC-type multidrug transport system fused ATPase/permease subunit